MKEYNLSGKKAILKELRLNLFKTIVNIEYFNENYELWMLDKPVDLKFWEMDKEDTLTADFYGDLTSARIFNKTVYSVIHSKIKNNIKVIVTTEKGATLKPERANSSLIEQMIKEGKVEKLSFDKYKKEIPGIITRSILNQVGNTPADPEANKASDRVGDPGFINPNPYYGNNYHGYTIKHYVINEDSSICVLEVSCSDYYKTDRGSPFTYEIAVKDGFWRIGRQTKNGDILFAVKRFEGSHTVVPALKTTELDRENYQSKSLFLARYIDYIKTNPELKRLIKIEPIACLNITSYEYGERESNVMAKQELLDKYMGKDKPIKKIAIDNACKAPVEFVEKMIKILTTEQSKTVPVIAPDTIFVETDDPGLPALRLVEKEVSENDSYLDDVDGRVIQHLQVKKSSLNPAVLRTVLDELCYKDMARNNDFSFLNLKIPKGTRFTILRGGGDAPTAIPRVGRLKRKLEDRLIENYLKEQGVTDATDKEERDKLIKYCNSKKGPVGIERRLRKTLFHFTTFIWDVGEIKDLKYGSVKKNQLPKFLYGKNKHPFITDIPMALTYPEDYPEIGGKKYFVVRTRLVPIIDRD